ncbi:MAG: HlyD family secretion protein [Candidatus Electronema aureum]|uniref:HlyD family secretion protein n=1 Tax=Candidatus Electronema aureum TaxID=2005002 RepID=A0A521G503_9BACT|nr:MAG: HlyD family secretion protein [Candidatus Electronema aureum]
MKLPHLHCRTFALITVIAPLLVLFIYVAMHSGPLAPVKVTVSTVESKSVAPALFGIGTVQARFTYKIGPTFTGRVKWLDVHVGDTVKAAQVLGEMDTVDLDDRIVAQQAAIKSSEAVVRQAKAKQSFAQIQVTRYEQLLAVRGASKENVATKQQELTVANAALAAAGEDVIRLRAELEGLRTQRGNLRLVAPAAGLVTARDAEPGTTVVAGQTVIEVIDPTSLWVDARFDQISAEGLAAGLPAQIVLRSRRTQSQSGSVLRIEPRADAVTEEILTKIVFDITPAPLPPLGESAEVTVQLDKLSAAPVVLNAAIRTVDGQRGAWRLVDGDLIFTPLTLGRSDLDGCVQIIKGLTVGDRVVLYSEKALSAKSRIVIVERLAGMSP